MFEGVQSVLPGHYLKIAFRSDGAAAEIVERRYWDFEFPDAGDEKDADDPALVDEFEATFAQRSNRLRADVPVVGYLSGGVDSAYVLAIASNRGAAAKLHHSGTLGRSTKRPMRVSPPPHRRRANRHRC